MRREPKVSPDELLQRAEDEARKEGRGKFKIYLGAAPGVGKTYEMLHDAMQERHKGLDVVVGVVDTHGREEIEGLLTDFEKIPQQLVEYRQKQLAEFDLDAALQRSPGLILIDEMAHTNVPGVRHHKRWQDIKELLDRGIDVYTTLNVQHIESLTDDVAQIIHAPIKETVPDFMIEMADTLELVDLPPEELLKRLEEGKVYFPQQISLAREHYFKKGNLIALRQLALRTTAERVGAEVLLYRQGEGIQSIWPVKDKILVCVGPKIESLKLIRAAKRIANSLQAEWLAVYVDKPGSPKAQQKRQLAIKHLRLAEQLGAQTRVLTGFDKVKEVLSFARDQNVTQVMIWKYIHNRWRDWLRYDLADEMVRQCGDIDVYIMTGEREEIKFSLEEESSLSGFFTDYWKSASISVAIIVAITLLNLFLFPYVAVGNLMMLYFVGLIIIASFGQKTLSVFASLVSVLTFYFFFIPPLDSLVSQDLGYLITLILMLVVSQVISHLAIRIRNQVELASTAQHQLAVLYTLSRQLSRTRGIKNLIEIGRQYMANNFNSKVDIFLPEEDHFEVYSPNEEKLPLDEKEYSIVQWVYELGEQAGFGTDTLSFSKALYLPLIAIQGTVGVVRIQPLDQQLFTPEQIYLLESCVHQIALTVEVDRLERGDK